MEKVTLTEDQKKAIDKISTDVCTGLKNIIVEIITDIVQYPEIHQSLGLKQKDI